MSKIMLTAGLIVLYGYGMEVFFAWYSGSGHEAYMMMNRVSGPYWWSFWALLFCNGVIPQLLWSQTIRTSPVPLFIIAIIINIGMWLERFVIVVVSLHRDYLPSAWGMYRPTLWDWGLFLGTIGLFIFLMTVFIRFLPMISLFEIRELLHRKQGKS
jgi:molybdopterin-containing oxidoreductase family membrane subunit